MLNPSKDLLYEVAAHLHDFGTNLFADTPVQVEVIGLTESLREVRVPVEWKRDVTLLFREALHNSLKHSKCENVRLEFGVCSARRTAMTGYTSGRENARLELGLGSARRTATARYASGSESARLEFGLAPDPGYEGGNGNGGLTDRSFRIALIELIDDGCGFGAAPGSNGGNGPENMARRARAVGGRLEIESSPEGTRIRLECPIEEDPQSRGVWRPASPVGPSLS
jgi:two-component sensor histidine kinase